MRRNAAMCFSVIKCLQPLSLQRGKLENISVIANDSILIEAERERVCMCVINELSFGTLRKYFYSLFSSPSYACSLSPPSLHDTSKRPPIAFVLLFTFQETMLDDDSRSSSGTPPATLLSEKKEME